MRSGTVYTETVVHSGPERFASQLPYQVIIVVLDTGGNITARVEGDRVAIDDRVTEIPGMNGIPVFRKTS
jgi:uncharacterized OB-fold protein